MANTTISVCLGKGREFLEAFHTFQQAKDSWIATFSKLGTPVFIPNNEHEDENIKKLAQCTVVVGKIDHGEQLADMESGVVGFIKNNRLHDQAMHL